VINDVAANKWCGCRSDGQNKSWETRKRPNFVCLEVCESEQRFQFLYVSSFRNCWISLDWASWLINKLRNTLDGGWGNCSHKWYHFCHLGARKDNPVSCFERSEAATESIHCGDCNRWMAGSGGFQFKVHVTALLNTGNDCLIRN